MTDKKIISIKPHQCKAAQADPAKPKAFASVLLFGEGATSYNKMFAQWCGYD